MTEESQENKTSSQNTPSTAIPTGVLIENKKNPFPHPLIKIFGVILLLLIGFIMGQSFERIRFRHNLQWRQNYQTNFFGKFQPREMRHIMGNIAPRPMRSFGILGTVLSMEESNFVVQDGDGNEQSIQIDDKTIFRFDRFQSKIPTINNIKVGNRIAVFGRPNNNGQIYATLIRIFSDNNPPTPSTNPIK